MLLKLRLHLSVVQHLLGLERCQQFLHIVESTLASEKFACRDVEKSHATLSLCHEHGSKEVVLLIVEHVVAHSHSGRDKFRNAALHERLGELRVFQLVAYSHTLARSDELGQIGVESVVGESCHFRSRSTWVLSVGASCQSDAENLSRFNGIFGIRLVEVATAEEQECVGMLVLERVELSHHWCQSVVILFLSHIL